MGKKKVLFVVHQLNIGGVQKAIVTLLDVLDYNKFDVTLFIRKDRLELLPEVNKNVKVIINRDKTHYYRKPYSIWLLFLIKLQSLLKNEEKEKSLRKKISEYIAEEKIKYEKKRYFSSGEEYDAAVSYIQGYTAKLVAEGVNAKRKIVFYHGSMDETHSVHEEIFDKFDSIVGVSGGVEEFLKTCYPKYKDKITSVLNFVDSAEILKKSKEYEVFVPKDKAVLCSCGRMTKVKGFDLATKAAKILKDGGEEFVWYFVGDGPERENIERKIAEYGLESEIVSVGMKANPYPYIKACDIYVQPSYEEACALTIIEAKTLLKPIASTITVGGKCLLADNKDGVLTEISAEGIASGVKKLLRNQDLKRKIINSLREEDWSKDKERYSEEINGLLEKA